ncbi:hypothetical protein DFS34DRAFT_639019 [Phlyctochytrium arcticum]|nr:hypothetical protein DFS34DRAFT_639019 [Phlyctochytrium arcticum]
MSSSTSSTSNLSRFGLLLAALALAPAVSAHMRIVTPGVWGKNEASLEQPLTEGSKNFLCSGRKRENSEGVTTINAGGQTKMPVVCGEAAGKPSDAANICAADPSAVHDGGGCALSITYKKDGFNEKDFTIFTANGACPTKKFETITFNVPNNLPACDDCVCAWTWIPQAAGAEMYMNCFNCKIVSQTNGTISKGEPLDKHLWALPGYPAKGNRPIYKNTLPNGALELQVSGAAAPPATPTTPSSAQPTDNSSSTKGGAAGSTPTETGLPPFSAAGSAPFTSLWSIFFAAAFGGVSALTL